MGRCPACGAWEVFERAEEKEKGRPRLSGAPQPLPQIQVNAEGRRQTGIEEFDRTLGGGIIPGSVLLIGGEPGVGKSTLLLQVAEGIARRHGLVLYISGEESPGQIKLRADRLGVNSDRLLILGEQSLSRIEEAIQDLSPTAILVDSIQSVFPPDDKTHELGSLRQVREVSAAFTYMAKSQGIPTLLVGHITKGGEFAGPKAIEHMVDVALYLEGEADGPVRMLRAVKNRFGSIDEVGVFEMGETGLKEITDPSGFFIRKGQEERSGSAVVPSLEGSRPILVEIQALVARAYGNYAQRRATGLDLNRMALWLAVVEKRLDVQIGREDVYLNVAGGLVIRETAVDLGATAAIVSSFTNRPISQDVVIVGEVGLNGEVRGVKRLRERLVEAERLGYRRAIVPAIRDINGLDTLKPDPVTDIEAAMEALSL